ncbi:hypothetical protein ACFOLG_13305 [Vogesella facilis]|uniref:ABC transporter domain-containing protein n=1 Tax=Vogesella facilis TaxID=1655232 RepID=A0ABV7RFS1_9NEIS
MLRPAYNLQYQPAATHDAPARTINLQLPANRLSIVSGGSAGERSRLLAALAGRHDGVHGQLFGQPACPQSLQQLTCRSAECEDGCRQTLHRYVLQGRQPHGFWWPRHDAHDLQVVELLLRELGLVPLSQQRLCQLDATTRQLASVARSLAAAAPIVLLDEPLPAAQPATRYQLLTRLQRLARTGRTIVLSLADAVLAAELADCLLDLDAAPAARSGLPHAA